MGPDPYPYIITSPVALINCESSKMHKNGVVQNRVKKQQVSVYRGENGCIKKRLPCESPRHLEQIKIKPNQKQIRFREGRMKYIILLYPVNLPDMKLTSSTRNKSGSERGERELIILSTL